MTNISKGQKRLLLVLVLVLAYAIFDFVKNRETYLSFYSGKKIKNPAKMDSRATAPTSGKPSTVRQNYEVRDWGRDPFYEAGLEQVVRKEAPQKSVTLYLKAISYSPENPVAMINNRIVVVGDIIEGYRVLKIEPKRVILGKGADYKILTIR